MNISERDAVLRGCIVGLGRMGLTHLAILNSHPGVRIGGVCDTSKVVLNSVRRLIDVPVFNDYEDMFGRVRPDFAVVATPATLHYAVGLRAIAAGIHLFVEKPFCETAAQAAELAGLASRRGLVNQVGYVNRFNEVFETVRRELEHGDLGRPGRYECSLRAPTVIRPGGAGWRSSKSSCGGCLQEFGSHCVDLASFFFGPPARVLRSKMEKVYSAQVDDLVCSELVHSSGVRGLVSCNWSDTGVRKPAYHVEISTDRATVHADQHEIRVISRQDGRTISHRYLTDLAEPVRFYVRGNEFTRQLDFFVGKVLSGDTANPSSFASAAATRRALESIEENARTCIN